MMRENRPGLEPGGPLLVADKLTKLYTLSRTTIAGKVHNVIALCDVSFELELGRTLSLVGESGSGKTTTGRLVLGLEKPTSGSVMIEGHVAGDRSMLGRIQVVFQDPGSSLDARMKVGAIVEEPLRRGGLRNKPEWRPRVEQMLKQVGLPPDAYHKYPNVFSGGQRQRIAIARALITDPDLIVLDEPFSSLDASVRAQIVNLLIRLQKEFRVSFLLISHDLASVRTLSDDVAVLYGGRLVEYGPADEIFLSPKHPYTQELLQASKLQTENGAPAQPDGDLGPSQSGCPFVRRCPSAFERCFSEAPRSIEIDNRLVSCHLFDSTADAQLEPDASRTEV